MCGIAGIFRPEGMIAGDKAQLERMNDALVHRGPDSNGLWCDETAGLGFGQRRLAIQDLSPAGHQPMLSASGRYVINLNGEIYNFHDLRARLEREGRAPQWRGHSDTEVLLAAIEAYGLEVALRELKGMYAIALFDREAHRLSLMRDPFGEKPLYVGYAGDALIFASELKGLTAHAAFSREISPDAIAGLLRHGYIGAPLTVYRDAWKVLPGEIVSFSLNKPARQEPLRALHFDALREAEAVRQSRFSGSGEEATDALDQLIHGAISRQMIADVPVGAFLSGGIDSSTIAAIMQAQRGTPIETFSLGFREAAFNEAPFARDVADHLGTSHNEIILTGNDARDLVTRMPAIYDEPFADPSQLPTFLVAGFARKKVTVALSGDAGDELFAGYGRYHSIARRRGLGLASSALALATRAYAAGLLAMPFGPSRQQRQQLGDMLAQARAPQAITAYERKFTALEAAHKLVPKAVPVEDAALARIAGMKGWSILDAVTSLDSIRYLPDDILVKVDRAAMAHSLETRIPLLDPDIARFAWSLPDEIKLYNGERKGLLKAVLTRYVPRSLWDRPKQGFGIPVAEWLKGPLNPLAEELFSRAALNRHDMLDADEVIAIWQDFKAGKIRRTNLIWSLFVAALYLDRKP